MGFEYSALRVTYKKSQFDSAIVHYMGYPAGARTCRRLILCWRNWYTRIVEVDVSENGMRVRISCRGRNSVIH